MAKQKEVRIPVPVEWHEDLKLIKKEMGISSVDLIRPLIRKAIEEQPLWLNVGTRRKGSTVPRPDSEG